ncbi:MAG: class I SAM-dependent methyltransferase [Anaerolineales bacterium]
MNQFETFLMTFDLGRKIYLRNIVEKLQKISQLPPNKKILEIGCGNGIGTRLIHEYFKPSELIATEYDESLVEITQEKVKDLNILVEQADATKFRFSNNEFDAVIGLSVIHHIPNWEEALDELHRIIKPKGLLIIKELSIETFETFFGKISRKFVEHPYDDMFRKDEFINYLKQKGFKLEILMPHSMLGFLSDFYLVARKW